MYKEVIATIDIGSSKIIAAIGKKDENGVIRILALEKESSGTAVRRGQVQNVEEVNQKIVSLLSRLNNKLDGKIEKIYVGVGGHFLITESGPTEEDLKNLSVKRNIDACISNNNVEIAGYVVNPIATAAAVLTEPEKEAGCALIEFGADITYLSVYKDRLLKYLVSIPLGGSVITKDVCSLQVSEIEAEKLKVTYGSALMEASNETIKLQDFPGKKIDFEVFNDIVEARTDEIIANIENLLKESGFADRLSDIIITGGGAALKNLAESIEEKINKKVRTAHIKEDLLNAESFIFGQTFGNEATIGLLSLGTEKCVEEPEMPITPPVQTEPTDIFGNPVANQNPIKTGKRKPLKKEPKEEQRGGKLWGMLTKKADEFSRTLFEGVDETDDNDDNETDKK